MIIIIINIIIEKDYNQEDFSFVFWLLVAIKQTHPHAENPAIQTQDS